MESLWCAVSGTYVHVSKRTNLAFTTQWGMAHTRALTVVLDLCNHWHSWVKNGALFGGKIVQSHGCVHHCVHAHNLHPVRYFRPRLCTCAAYSVGPVNSLLSTSARDILRWTIYVWPLSSGWPTVLLCGVDNDRTGRGVCVCVYVCVYIMCMLCVTTCVLHVYVSVLC